MESRKHIEEESFGKLKDGTEVKSFKLVNKTGMVVEASNIFSA